MESYYEQKNLKKWVVAFLGIFICVCFSAEASANEPQSYDFSNFNFELPSQISSANELIIDNTEVFIGVEDALLTRYNNDEIEKVSQSINKKSIKEEYISEDVDEILNVVGIYNKNYAANIITRQFNPIPQEVTNSYALLNELQAACKHRLTYGPVVPEEATNYRFSLKLLDINVQGDLAKVLIYRDLATHEDDFRKGTEEKIFLNLGSPEGYVLEKQDNGWKLINVIFCTDFVTDAFVELDRSEDPREWREKFSYHTLPRSKYDGKNFVDYHHLVETYNEELMASQLPVNLKAQGLEEEKITFAAEMYSKSKAYDYAMRYGATPNLNYRYFGRHGDCTNFISQCIKAGGLHENGGWYYNGPFNYSRSWTIVDDLRNYLINNKKARGYYQKLPDYPHGVGYRGTVIQISNGSKWVHSVILTDENIRNNAIYVAEHSGPQGDTTSRKMSNDFSNRRSFWIGGGY